MYPQSSFKEAHFFWELSVSENYVGISEWTESYRQGRGERNSECTGRADAQRV